MTSCLIFPVNRKITVLAPLAEAVSACCHHKYEQDLCPAASMESRGKLHEIFPIRGDQNFRAFFCMYLSIPEAEMMTVLASHCLLMFRSPSAKLGDKGKH